MGRFTDFLNTEMGLLIDSPQLAKAVLNYFQPDFAGGSSWRVEFTKDANQLRWVGNDGEVYKRQPDLSTGQRINDWFFWSVSYMR